MVDPSIALQVAWAAGLFEGEGSFTLSRKREKGRASPTLSIASSDLDVLLRVKRLFGGSTGGPRIDTRRPNSKPMYWWTVANWDDFERIGNMMLPYLGERRSARFHEIMAQKPFDHWRRPKTDLCAEKPWPSVAGYLRHRKRGEPACEVCMESYRLFSAAKRRAAVIKGPRSQTECPGRIVASQAGALRHRYHGEPVCDICRESAALYWRLYRDRKRQEGQPSEITN